MSANTGIEPWNNIFLREHARCTCTESEAAIELKPLSCFNVEMMQTLSMKTPYSCQFKYVYFIE